MLKRIFILILLLTFFAPLEVAAEGGAVVINSFRISGNKNANDEYVEILNKEDFEIDLSGWKLGRKTATGSPSYLRTVFPENTKIGPGNKITIGHKDCNCTFDLEYATTSGSTPSGLAPDNTIILYNKDKFIIDKVGYGKAIEVETKGIDKSPGDEEIYSRRNKGQDTDNNFFDFELTYTPPKEEVPAAEEKPEVEESKEISTATSGARISVTEFMPNPEGADSEGEWIEIYNAGGEANISGYAIADRMGSPKKYKFPEGTIIKSGQYLAFYSSKTPISLNNDNEAVDILDPNSKVISSSAASGKGPEGSSFAFDGSGWSWTSKATPGRANIIEKPVENSDGDEKGEVLSLVDERQLTTQVEGNVSQTERDNDRLLGYALIVLAIIGAISYTLYINKERLREIYYKIRKRNSLAGSEIWQKIKRR